MNVEPSPQILAREEKATTTTITEEEKAFCGAMKTWGG